MDFDELLEMQKKVDQYSIAYQTLKEKLDDLYNKYYQNDMRSKENVVQEEKEDEEDKEKEEARFERFKGKIIGFALRYLVIMMFKLSFDFSDVICAVAIILNLFYYYAFIFDDMIKADKKNKKEETEEINPEEVFEEIKILEKKVKYVQEKYFTLSAKYQELVGRLTEKEYQEYLMCVSEYLQNMLENSDDVLSDSLDNVLEDDELKLKLPVKLK